MTKLTGEAKVIRELPIEDKGRPIVVTVTPRGLIYKAKGRQIPLAYVDHEVAIAAGQKVAARESGVKV